MNLESLKKICDIRNLEEGNDEYYQCEICKNRGYVLVVDEENGSIDTKVCSCMLHRNNKRDIEKLGLVNLFETYTFKTFETDEEWQSKFKTKAWEFATDPKGWLFIGGQIGSGKTLAGISVLNELMNRNYRCKFVQWQSLMQNLKAHLNEQQYFDVLNEYSNVEVLYLDDLFKGGYNNTPTDSDVRLTQIIIDSRYVNGKVTIISSELLMKDVLNISESIGSRIVERAKGNMIQIVKDKERNWRLR